LAIKSVGALRDTKVIRKSGLFNTSPCGGPKGQPDYLNAALKIQTGLSPAILLKNLKNIEFKIGRTPGVRFGPRLIDLDILLYGDKIIRSRDLIVPHPRMFSRDFVIKPLLEVL
jgi:2-amino-4-hydroxy-6-hydroxymethyldihydropteridine diphosphokinase